jgi:hypothetical protein
MLSKGTTNRAVGRNIRIEMAAGHTREQAIAIALSVRDAQRRKEMYIRDSVPGYIKGSKLPYW